MQANNTLQREPASLTRGGEIVHEGVLKVSLQTVVS